MVSSHFFISRRFLVVGLIALSTVIILSSCDSDDTTGPGTNGKPTVSYDLYVDATTGDDTNAGTEQAPFKTITLALSVAAVGDSVKVAPATYDTALGESFPIQIPDSVTLIGDEDNRGMGSVPTEIRGQGPVPSAPVFTTAILGGHGSRIAGFLVKAEDDSVLRFGVYSRDVDFTVANNSFDSTFCGVRLAGTGNPVVMGNSFSTGPYGVHNFCDGFATIQNNEFLDGETSLYFWAPFGGALVYGNLFATTRQAIWVHWGSPTIDSNTFTGVYSHAVWLSSSSSKLRNNHFEVESGPCVVIESNASPDLGISTDPGGNVFAGNSGVAIHHKSPDTVYAIGNTWYSSSPVCGTEIVIDSGGVVVWGTGASERCP